MGASIVSSIGAGCYNDLYEINTIFEKNKKIKPKMNKNIRKKIIKNWHKAVKKTIEKVD